MKTIGFENFSFEKYRISHVSVIRQKNAWTNLCHPEGRGCNGFILIINGKCCYKWGDNSKNLSKGGLIYLPKGSRHSVSAPEKTLDFYRVNFTVEEISKEEEIIFSDEAKPISDKTPEMLYGLCEELCKATLQHGTDFKIMALLCEFINHCVFMSTPEGVTGFDAAIKKLNKSYTMPISIEALAEECFISPSHLFRLFKERLGMTPFAVPIRGGTDGARLSFMGLPCPNLPTGGGNYHSRYEYVSIDAMEKCVDLVIEIVKG